MADHRSRVRPQHYKVLVVAACIFSFLFAAAFIVAKPSTRRVEINPVVSADMKRAQIFRKKGDWKQYAGLLAPHITGNNPSAKLEFALLLSRGWGVERDRERARQLLLQAVSFDFPGRGKAAFELGRLYKIATGEDCTRIALQWFIKAAQWNYTKAHLELGTAYKKGLGTMPSASKAMRHYKVAANKGSATAIWLLVNMVENGMSDLEPDPDMARSLADEYLPRLIADARGGNAYAARTIARFYNQGRVVPHSRSKAGRWFTEAARLGDPAAMHDLAQLLMSDEEAEASVVVDLLKQSANRGYGAAASALGRLHLQERYGLQRPGAIDWFAKGTEAGHGGAFEELGRIYLLGELIGADPAEAIRLAKMGAKLRHKGSLRLLKEIETAKTAEPEPVAAAQSTVRR